MAIPHLTTNPLSRSKGASAVAASAYNSRSRLTDERTGQVHDYARKKEDVLWSGLYMPKHTPERLQSREALWNAAEQAETRVNSRPARRVDVGLPHELTLEENRRLLQDFVRENFQRQGIAADVTIHRPTRQGDERNIHAHILITTREVTPEGMGAKNRDIDRTETTKRWREQWEKLVNRHLERAGHEARISMRSLADQGVDRTPSIHMGKSATAQERKGAPTERGDDQREIRNRNIARMIAEELHRQQTETTLDRLRKHEIEEREEALRRAERDLTFTARGTAADREMLKAVRSLMVTMAPEMERTGFDPERFRVRKDYKTTPRAQAERVHEVKPTPPGRSPAQSPAHSMSSAEAVQQKRREESARAAANPEQVKDSGRQYSPLSAEIEKAAKRYAVVDERSWERELTMEPRGRRPSAGDTPTP